MPDRQAMKYTAAHWASADEDWKRHLRRCATCRACTCEPPSPAELCGDGAALRETITARLAAWGEATARTSGWRF